MNKKTVHYSEVLMDNEIVVGRRVWVIPTDHPDTWNVTNGTPCLTSQVVNYDEATGVFETLYSVYVPVGTEAVDINPESVAE